MSEKYLLKAGEMNLLDAQRHFNAMLKDPRGRKKNIFSGKK